MAKTNWQDPKTSEIRSTHISGLQEAIGKLEESIGIETTSETNVPLSEVFISNDDRCRIYQAPEGKRNWLLSPTPIIKKNGKTISTGFEIDYGGGAVIFTTPLLETDNLTADIIYTKKVDGKQLSTEDFTTAEKNKLSGITTGATKNDTDANLKNRANHTGTQLSSTISDFATAIRSTVLTGLSNTTNAVITATDTVLSALGKLQKQITDNLLSLNTHIGNKSNPHNVKKADVELENVDNIKQMPISGGVLKNYREKLITLTGLTPNVDLSIANVFKLTLEGATTLSISNTTIDVSQSFTLIIIQPSIAHSINFPANVKWMNETIPDLSTANKVYYLLFDTIDGGVTWHGRFGGAF
ncbi:hypothetical protein ACR77J_12025 [Tissierella praeacuta]|uniref:hypothetical protein n=1 Tax=Tissierella praeacuta TaxID=43131 RepID=UPI003DA530D3